MGIVSNSRDLDRVVELYSPQSKVMFGGAEIGFDWHCMVRVTDGSDLVDVIGGRPSL